MSEFCQKYFKELNQLSNNGWLNVFLPEQLDQNIFLSEKSKQKYKEYFNELKYLSTIGSIDISLKLSLLSTRKSLPIYISTIYVSKKVY